MMLKVTNAIYHRYYKVPKYSGQLSIIDMDYANGGRYLRHALPNYSKQQHIANAKSLARDAKKFSDAWNKIADRAAQATWGRPFLFHDYKISGIGSDEFSDSFKNKLRNTAVRASQALDAAYAHYAAAGKRLDTARADLNKIADK